MLSRLNRWLRDDRGTAAIEYGLIAGLVSVVIIAALTLLGGNLTNVFNAVAGAMPAG